MSESTARWYRVVRRSGLYSIGVTIPRTVTDRIGWNPGDEVEITEVNGEIRIKKEPGGPSDSR